MIAGQTQYRNPNPNIPRIAEITIGVKLLLLLALTNPQRTHKAAKKYASI
jgi:hypothetical protein